MIDPVTDNEIYIVMLRSLPLGRDRNVVKKHLPRMIEYIRAKYDVVRKEK